MPAPPWHLITGEYPPAPGGVADYSRSVAWGLAATGDEVHVWAPVAPGRELTPDPGVTLHALRDGFGPGGLGHLAREFARHPSPRRVLLQYVPQAFGLKGMNLPFCAWLASLRRTEIWVMFHEVFVGWESVHNARRFALAVATQTMAALLLARADRVFVSTTSWETNLRSVAVRNPRATWLPIPSGLPAPIPHDAHQQVRTRLAGAGTVLVGHFGTYGPSIAPFLRRTALDLLNADPRLLLLLVGRGGECFARDLSQDPALAGRVVATGGLAGGDVAAHLAACKILIQPYGDGVSTRRTSLMAGLSIGVPIATNEGFLSEPFWRHSRAVELAPSPDGVAAAAAALLRDPVRASEVGERGRELYRARFSLERTIETLRHPAAEQP
jgi:glycosyltransferase involved in cell wall biosynthesis